MKVSSIHLVSCLTAISPRAYWKIEYQSLRSNMWVILSTRGESMSDRAWNLNTLESFRVSSSHVPTCVKIAQCEGARQQPFGQ